MKALIEKQVARREMADHVKLGPGGIREVEFIVQAFQLIRGGQDRRLQTARLLEVLPLLARRRLLSEAAIAGARRRLPLPAHAREPLADDPRRADAPAADRRATRERLARAPCREPSWDTLRATLDGHRERVQAHFRALVFRPVEETEGDGVAAERVAVVGRAHRSRRRTTRGPTDGNRCGGHRHPRSATRGRSPAQAVVGGGLGVESLREAFEAAGLGEAVEAARLVVEFRSGSPAAAPRYRRVGSAPAPAAAGAARGGGGRGRSAAAAEALPCA